MPTTRPRHQVTETDAVAHALDLAEKHWPGESRARLLVRLVERGAAILAAELNSERRRRERLIDDLSGKYAGMYPDGYLEELRKDWPA
jgi:hypothetical protein